MAQYPNNIEIAKKLLDQQAEINRLKAKLHEAQKIVKLVDKLITDEVLYDDSEGDCTFCGAEAYEDGYHHEKGCWTFKLESALQLYKARVARLEPE